MSQEKNNAPPLNLDDLLNEVTEELDVAGEVRGIRQGVSPEALPDMIDTVRWAREVYGVVEDDPERFRALLRQHAAEEPTSYISQMLPRAMAILDRQANKRVDDELIQRAESRSVGELRVLLKSVLAQATPDQVLKNDAVERALPDWTSHGNTKKSDVQKAPQATI